MAVVNVTEVERTLREVLRREVEELVKREVSLAVEGGCKRIREGIIALTSKMAFDIQRNVNREKFGQELVVVLDVRTPEEKGEANG